MRLSRNGVSLIELLVATTVGGLLAVMTAMVLTGARARLEERKARLAAEQALRAVAAATGAFLQDAGESGADLQAIGPAGFTVRAIRGTSVLCATLPGGLVARRGEWWSAVREPVAGRDSLAVGTLTGAGWILDALRADPYATPCPDGGAGIALPVGLDPAQLAALGPGSPLRLFEPVELRSYSSAGSDWIGLRQIATGEAIQPLAGPLARPGLTLEYFAADASVASQPVAVVSVGFRVRVLTTDNRPDSLTGTVLLSDR